MEFRDGPIDGVVIRALQIFSDKRGWLAEVFRKDEISPELDPAMAYLSMTHPGVHRGPHAHRDQTDYFVFFNAVFKVYLWDDREGSSTRGFRHVVTLGSERPACVIVPPAVVHAYRNVSDQPGVILNLPNRLYAGHGKGEPVDEIRYEEDPGSPYRLEE
jgi:dTDP-4-dehydrorhamnose 3,5-epimerase